MVVKRLIERIDNWYLERQRAALEAEKAAERQRKSTIEKRLADSRLLFWLLLELLKPSPDKAFVSLAMEALLTEEDDEEVLGQEAQEPSESVSENEESNEQGGGADDARLLPATDEGTDEKEDTEGGEDDIFEEKDDLPSALRSIINETVPVPCVYVPYPQKFRVRKKDAKANVYILIPTHIGYKKGKSGDLVVIHGLGGGFTVDVSEVTPLDEYPLNPLLLFRFSDTANNIIAAIEKEGFGSDEVSLAWRTLTYPKDEFVGDAVRTITLVAEGNMKMLRSKKPLPPPSLLVDGARVYDVWLDNDALGSALEGEPSDD